MSAKIASVGTSAPLYPQVRYRFISSTPLEVYVSRTGGQARQSYASHSCLEMGPQPSSLDLPFGTVVGRFASGVDHILLHRRSMGLRSSKAAERGWQGGGFYASQRSHETRSSLSCPVIRTTSVMNAVRMLREFDIGFLPVIDDLWTRKLIGVVTDRDLCLAALGEQHDPTLTTVEDCMATDPVTSLRIEDIREILAAMAEHQIRRLPVVDQGNHDEVGGIGGIATIFDIMLLTLGI